MLYITGLFILSILKKFLKVGEFVSLTNQIMDSSSLDNLQEITTVRVWYIYFFLRKYKIKITVFAFLCYIVIVILLRFFGEKW